ncbi:hypothetical protein ACIPSA_42435 [Streptomyces sp. NPDC086549]|uniref:hypothetical protein n=1 Tax=Streptomyces sp. NPDC086549 TaxID=3365752 RepID=UPI0038033009
MVVSTVIALVSLYFQAARPEPDPEPTRTTSRGAAVGPGPGGDTPTPTPTDSATTLDTGTSTDDGLTSAEHDLRDSLNSDQWSHESCSHSVWQGAKAALYCTVTTVDEYGVSGTGKASVVMYDTKADRDAVFQSYAAGMPAGNCDSQTNVSSSWRENNTSEAAGDAVCFLSSTGQYVFLCSYYDRPALVEISGPDQTSLAAWWHTMEPVFTD